MFGKVLDEMIKEKFQSKTEFAKLCNFSNGHLTDLIKGRTLPKEENLQMIIEILRLDKTKKEILEKEWGLDKAGEFLRKKYEKLEEDNRNMFEVLKRVENERILMGKIDKMKVYEMFYNNIFSGLNVEESKAVLKAIRDRLMLIAIDKKNVEKTKEKFEKLDKIIEKIK